MDMKTGPYDPTYTERQDNEHLQMLSIFYYVKAGLAALGGMIPGVYMLFGLLMLVGGAVADVPENDAMPLAIFGGIIIVVCLAIIALCWLYAYCLYLTGNYLREGRNRTFCFVMAGLSCLNAPLGTVLGIFTIIVLSRDSVRARFERSAYGQFPPAGIAYQQPSKQYG
jgi:hypothetical protein